MIQPSRRVQLFGLCLAFAHVLHAAPIPNYPTPLTVSTGLPSPSTAAPAATSSIVASDASPQQLWPSPLTLTDPSPTASNKPTSTEMTASPATATSTVTSIDTEMVTVTATETAAPVTVTQTLLETSTFVDQVTVTASPPTAASSAVSPPSSVFDALPEASSVSTAPSSASQTPSTSASSSVSTPTSTSTSTWTVPTDFDNDLSKALGSERWSWGQSNAEIVNSIPATAWAAAATPTSTAGAKNQAASFPTVDLSNGPAMQVLFPKGSINPANKNAPTGGVGLYMSPLDLSKATNVTLEYSVFFPSDFDFVKGGKLPGLYGGHKGCSGGQESEDCFSTRLMFRTGGKGELYLYVPKNVQPEALCNTPPLSYCDSKYGLSIGRGSWTFERGAWSNIRQEIRLNTPGVADGGFRIFVNDKLVLSSDAVLFRADLAPETTATASSPFSSLPTAPPKPSATTPADPSAEASAPSSTATEDDGLLGGLLGGGLLGGLGDELGHIIKRQRPTDSADRGIASSVPTVTKVLTATPTTTVWRTSTVSIAAPTSSSDTFSPLSPLGEAGLVPQVANALPLLDNGILGGGGSVLAPKKKPQPESDNAVFDGIMFNTFFGGNSESYASPKDQYIWFNRIGLTVNA
ncbi:hypothetical protein JCM10212_003835 [Sporobolomyces blumeae]